MNIDRDQLLRAVAAAWWETSRYLGNVPWREATEAQQVNVIRHVTSLLDGTPLFRAVSLIAADDCALAVARELGMLK